MVTVNIALVELGFFLITIAGRTLISFSFPLKIGFAQQRLKVAVVFKVLK